MLVLLGGNGTGFYYSIPWNFISQFLEITKTYNYVIAYEINNTTEKQEIEVIYGGATVEDAIYNQGLSQNDKIDEQTNAINNQTQVIEQQTQKIEETTDAVNDLNNTISDPNIDSGADDLPSLELNNPANTPLDNIFTLIYNAFCTGEPHDIVFPIPFTNKNITLSPYYIRDMLNNNGGAWVVTFINMFWEFMVGLFIIKDVSHKINKIKSGNIENIQNENIKEDML